MKIGIIGLPQVGKKTLFDLLTGGNLTKSAHANPQEIKIAPAIIRDSRFDRLVEMYKPAKNVPATIDVVLIPKFDKEALTSGEFLKSLEKCDAICHIVRAFSDESIFHVDGSIDAVRDIENVYSEIILSDLILVEKRLERIAQDKKKGNSDANQAKELEILNKMKLLLDENKPLINFKLTDDEKKIMSTYVFLSRKPMIIVLNVDDDKIQDAALIGKIEAKYKDYGFKIMQVSAKIEAELNSLEAAERQTFLDDLKIKESALNLMGKLYFEALGLITFFTVGEDEVRAWITKKGFFAPQAAGTIHSDLEKGFIRAEIMKTSELFEYGNELKLKEAGKFLLKGKDYVVEDGDIMHVRFNV